MRRNKKTFEQVVEVFWSFVDVKGPDECWLWLGGISGGKKGTASGRGVYGVFADRGKQIKAHRFSLQLVLGRPLLPWHTEQALHNCPGGDNPLCVNPAHLYLGNHKKNMKDMVDKGRSFKNKGEFHGMAKMTEDKVRIARRLHSKNWLQEDIAWKLGVCRSTVQLVLARKTWTHVK